MTATTPPVAAVKTQPFLLSCGHPAVSSTPVATFAGSPPKRLYECAVCGTLRRRK